MVAKGDVKLGLTFLFAFLLALWSANGGIKAIIDALNVVYDEEEKREFFRLNPVSLAFTFGGLSQCSAPSAPLSRSRCCPTLGLGAATDVVVRTVAALVLAVLFGLSGSTLRAEPPRPNGAG